MSTPVAEQANTTSIDAPTDVSEWELSGLTRAPSVSLAGQTTCTLLTQLERQIHVKAPRIRESAFSMECELSQAMAIAHPETGAPSVTLVLGLVKKIHVRNDVLVERRSQANPGDVVNLVDPTKLQALGRMGDITYTSYGPLYRIARPVWADEKEKVEQLSNPRVGQ